MICDYCGEERIFDLIEIWPEERAWMFDACCEEYHASLLEDLDYAMVLSAQERVKFLAPLRELFAGYGVKVRQAFDSMTELGSFRLDFGLQAAEIDLATAKRFIGLNHAHNAPPLSWRWGHALRNGDELVAVATVGRPVARMIDGKTTVEVTRLCVDRELDKELTWNACSQLYSAAAKEAKKRGFKKIITYTLETESGHALKAAGWVAEWKTKGGSWNRPSRGRVDKAPTCRKVRWAKYLEVA